jgi:hypothetical protein
MGLFNKKEKIPKIPPALKLPQLPKLNSAQPSVNQNSNETTSLPSLPHTSHGENLNQEIVKSAVEDSSGENEVKVDELPQNFRFQKNPHETNEAGEQVPQIPVKQHESEENKQRTMEIAQPKHSPEHQSTQSPSSQFISETGLEENHMARGTEPVFVRIDKFQDSQKKFAEIDKKVKEIEKILGKVKQVKIKEDAEISKWSEDLEKIKSGLSEIDSDIFNQI